MARLAKVILVLMLFSVRPAYAVQPDEMLSDPLLEARARAMSRDLRCMVCQNQSIDDSDAPLARDLRLLVRERIKAGDSDQQIFDFLTARYGDFVLLNPRFTWRNMALWLLPALALFGGIGVMVSSARRQRAIPVEVLTAAEEKRLAKLIQKEKE